MEMREGAEGGMDVPKATMSPQKGSGLLSNLTEEEAVLADMSKDVSADVPPIKKQITKKQRTTQSRGRRGRSYSPTQYSALVACLQAERYPNREQLINIARYVSLDLIRVRTWYQNARIRGVSDAGTIDIPVTAQEILNGTAAPAGESKDPNVTVAKKDTATQCDLLPSSLFGLYATGALNTILIGLGKVPSRPAGTPEQAPVPAVESETIPQPGFPVLDIEIPYPAPEVGGNKL
ncbi:Homeobox domain [Carpediemonas membranifera]|uniref:Homeobox domain n=1 Tax=Carpediemonas membranifera TaxID=201153 RepID=A0A8J6BA15_9EUKA|nr:Homeobox domain [Carpediemonas membranifera]|eukprot:KAG9395852.1 Homeobox domain [Carpediemonas membranifera]